MNEPKKAKFEWGQRVMSAIEIFNDGTHPEAAEDSLLVPRGTSGEIVNVGAIESTGDPVYIIEFANKQLVGVYEDEIVRA